MWKYVIKNITDISNIWLWPHIKSSHSAPGKSNIRKICGSDAKLLKFGFPQSHRIHIQRPFQLIPKPKNYHHCSNLFRFQTSIWSPPKKHILRFHSFQCYSVSTAVLNRYKIINATQGNTQNAHNPCKNDQRNSGGVLYSFTSL